MSAPDIGVAIATNGRCGPLLRHLVAQWRAIGARVAVAGGRSAMEACQELRGEPPFLHLLELPDGPAFQGDLVAAAFDALDADWTLRVDDDVLPVGPGWIESLPLTPGSLRAVRMIDLLGRRWFDWACRTDEGAFLQDYSEHRPRTFITGSCQLWSREARAAASYRGRPYRTGADAQICEDAEAAGILLLPPEIYGPTLVHLDRRPDVIRRPPPLTA
jgi:hypothetical protein